MLSLLLFSTLSFALDSNVNPGSFKIMGSFGVSAQQAQLGYDGKVYVIDKAESNPMQINGHSAWAEVYDPSTNQATPIDVMTNTFCASGEVLGDGNLINVGGNNPVTTGGVSASPNAFQDADGGKTLRLLTPGTTNFWEDQTYLTQSRWYATTVTMGDGSAAIFSGDLWGGYISSSISINPTVEYWPNTGNFQTGMHTIQFLVKTTPLSLYPLAWLMPSGQVFMQAAYSTIMYDPKSQNERSLPDMPHAVRVYPASGAVSMLPLKPSTGYQATILFCGGQNLPISAFGDQGGPQYPVSQITASQSCVRITPDAANPVYEEDDDLMVGRTMGNFIILPTQKLFLVNGAQSGTAGYGTPNRGYPWVVGQSYADHAVLQPHIYDPEAPRGSRFSTDGMAPSTIPRMYHSTATLLPDGSVWVSGSNPNADVSTANYATEYRTEKFYPSYYNQPRPTPKGVPSKLSYGGAYFDITLSASDLGGNVESIKDVTVIVIRTGFSTHGVNFGMRSLQLNTTYDATATNGVLHVSQMPPNSNLFAPGPALLFVVVNGVPSIGQQVMIGSGKVETQQMQSVVPLPASRDVGAPAIVLATPATLGAYALTGCFVDNVNQRLLSNKAPLDFNTMTQSACAAYAQSIGAIYFGLEYSGECWTSTMAPTVAALTDNTCNMACTGSSTENCGAGNRILVYGTKSTTLQSSGGATYAGCYVDSVQNRVMPARQWGLDGTKMTPQLCISTCTSLGYAWSGLEYAAECYCAIAMTMQPVDNSGCNMAASGDATLIAGGPNRLSVYHNPSVKTPQVLNSYVSAGSTWTYRSCWGEPAQGRALPNLLGTGLTVERCLDLGTAAGFKDCGVEYGGECWCNNQPAYGGAIPDQYCSMTTPTGEVAGGPNTLTYYTR